MEQIISKGPEEMASMFIRLFDLPIHMEREQFPCAGHYDLVSPFYSDLEMSIFPNKYLVTVKPQ